jgi:hypothetical protein
MRHLSLILLATFALVLGACQADDGGGEATETLDLGSLPAASASAEASLDAFATPLGDADASATSSPDDSDDASASPDDSDDASASPDGTDGAVGSSSSAGTAAGDCEDAFDDVPDLAAISSLRDLQDALDAIDESIEACDSVDDWTAAAEGPLNLEGLDTDAETFLAARCDENDDIEDTDICEELDS